MIDVENAVFGPIAKELRTRFPKIEVTGEYMRAPAKFPHVSITESDNYQPSDHADTSGTEATAVLMYEVNVYSNKTGGKKQQCREILGVIDKMLYACNFRRTVMTPIPNMEDATIYRLVARYQVETDGKYFYRR